MNYLSTKLLTSAGFLILSISTAVPVQGWLQDNGKFFWYEQSTRQGTTRDTKGVLGDGTVRGREIFDPESRGWYWLDACYDGAKAVNKEVWMPYIYQEEATWDDAMKQSAASLSGTMKDQVYNAMKNGTGKWVRYDEEGKMYKGWYSVSMDSEIYPEQRGNSYYYDEQTGLMAKGWTVINNTNYYFDEVSGVYDKIINPKDGPCANGHTLFTWFQDYPKEECNCKKSSVTYEKCSVCGWLQPGSKRVYVGPHSNETIVRTEGDCKNPKAWYEKCTICGHESETYYGDGPGTPGVHGETAYYEYQSWDDDNLNYKYYRHQYCKHCGAVLSDDEYIGCGEMKDGVPVK